jgi:hypothetical protein
VQGLEDDLRARVGDPPNPVREIEDRHHRARVPDVENLPDRRVILEDQEQRLHDVVDVAPGTDLRAVPVDHELVTGQRSHGEVVDRPAAELARAVDVERAHGAGRQPELVEIGVRKILARELGDGVRPASLADGALRRHVRLLDLVRMRAKDLARRKVDHSLERRPGRVRGLEHVVRADQVHAHRPHRALEHCVHASDSGHVHDCVGAFCELAHERRVEDVALDEGQVRMVGQHRARQRVPVEVVEDDQLVLLDKPPRERRADESGAARDEDAPSAQRHGTTIAVA